jgi:hypothetical protein
MEYVTKVARRSRPDTGRAGARIDRHHVTTDRRPAHPSVDASLRDLVVAALATYTLARALGLLVLRLVELQLSETSVAVGSRFRGWSRMLMRWDAFYYEAIATDGYPSHLPVDAQGEVIQNVWAFFPAFPLGATGVAAVTGLDFETAAWVLNLGLGAVAAVALACLTRAVTSDDIARRTVVFWSFFPTAFVLQVPYSEAAYAAVTGAFLLALCSGRFSWASVLLLAAGLTRGSIAPLSVAALVAVARQLLVTRRPASTPALARLAALSASAVLAPVLWIATAAMVTGRADAYIVTQRAWGYEPDVWLWVARWPDALSGVGTDWITTVSVGALAATATLAIASVRLALPLTLRAYTLAATALLFAMAMPGAVAFGSVPRFAFGVLTLPIVLALLVRHRLAVHGLVVAFLAMQYWWVLNVWSGRLGVPP